MASRNFGNVKAAPVNGESDQKKSSAEEGGKGRPVAAHWVIMQPWLRSAARILLHNRLFRRSDLHQPLMRAEPLISFGPVLMAVVRQMSQEACQSVSQGSDGKAYRTTGGTWVTSLWPVQGCEESGRPNGFRNATS